jgi:Leucine-rich repeat (LRR) protein
MARRRELKDSPRPLSLAEASDEILRQHERQQSDDEPTSYSIYAAGFPIGDLDALPSRVQDILRHADNVNLSDTPLRQIPAWLLCRVGNTCLAGCPISSLPELSASEVEEWHSLCEDAWDAKVSLDLARTQVSTLPESWAELERIERIELDHCPLDERSFETLPSLEALSATHCGLRDITAFGDSPSSLDLSDNPFGRIPDSIRAIYWKGLTQLTLSRCGITEIPAWIEEAELPPIYHLNLSGNPIHRIDFKRGGAPVRQTLDLSYCRISEVTAPSFSRGFRGAAHVIDGELNLSWNLLRELPPMEYPASLNVSSNPLRALPEPLNTFDYDPAEDASHSSGRWVRCEFRISASQTAITQLPAALERLPISELSLSRCNTLTSLPDYLMRMGTLRDLQLDDVPLQRVTGSQGSVEDTWSPEFRDHVSKLVTESAQGWGGGGVTVRACGATEIFPLRELVGHCDRPLGLQLGNAALRSIADGDISESVATLDLSGSAIESLPSRMGRLTKLTELDLSNTRLKELPSDLGELKSLQSLKLPALEPSQYPEGLEGLSSLRSLELCGSALVRIPDFVHRLPALEELVITDTSIDELPEQLRRCQTLNRVCITKALACRVPESVLRLPSLTSLQVSGVASVSFESIPKGCALKELSVTECGRLAMPHSVDGFANLQTLTLSANIADIPDAVCELPSLTRINLGSEDGYGDRPGTAALRRRLSAGARALLDG